MVEKSTPKKSKKKFIIMSIAILALVLIIAIPIIITSVLAMLAGHKTITEKNATDNGLSFHPRVEDYREYIVNTIEDSADLQYVDVVLAVIQALNEGELDKHEINDRNFRLDSSKCMNGESISAGTKKLMNYIHKAGAVDINDTSRLMVAYTAYILNDEAYIKYALNDSGYSCDSVIEYLTTLDKKNNMSYYAFFAESVNDYVKYRRTGISVFEYPLDTQHEISLFNPEAGQTGIIYRASEGQAVNSIGNGIVENITNNNGNTVLLVNYGDYKAEYHYLSKISIEKGKEVVKGQKIGEPARSVAYDAYIVEIKMYESESKTYVNPKDFFNILEYSRKYYTDGQKAVGLSIADTAYQIYLHNKKIYNDFTYTSNITEDGDTRYCYDRTKLNCENFVMLSYDFTSKYFWDDDIYLQNVDKAELNDDTKEKEAINKALINTNIRFSASNPSDAYRLFYNQITNKTAPNSYGTASCYVFDDPRFMDFSSLACILYPGDIIVYEASSADLADDEVTDYKYAIYLGNGVLYSHEIGAFGDSTSIYANYCVIMPVKSKNENEDDHFIIQPMDEYGQPIKVLRFIGDEMPKSEYSTYKELQ